MCFLVRKCNIGIIDQLKLALVLSVKKEHTHSTMGSMRTKLIDQQNQERIIIRPEAEAPSGNYHTRQ